MRISQTLPKIISDKRSLLIVTSRQDAKFIAVQDRETEVIGVIEIPHPKYSDNEGFTIQSGKGDTFSAGGARKDLQNIKEKQIREFMIEFKKKIQEIAHHYAFDNIFIFSPDYMKHRVEDVLPADWRTMIRAHVLGNYYQEKEHVLFEKLGSEITTERVMPESEDAQKILRKARDE